MYSRGHRHPNLGWNLCSKARGMGPGSYSRFGTNDTPHKDSDRHLRMKTHRQEAQYMIYPMKFMQTHHLMACQRKSVTCLGENLVLADKKNQKSTLESSHLGRRHTRPPPVTQSSQPVYVIVFGYPPEKYPSIVEYFKSLGSATEPEPNTEILNCFRIGYHDAADALRAVRKNGEVFAGSWMIGAKWAVSNRHFIFRCRSALPYCGDLQEPAQVEALLGQPLLRSSISGPSMENNSPGGAMNVDEPMQSPFSSNTPSVGTPIRLAPSTSAFRKAGAPSKPTTPLPVKPMGVPATPTTTPTSNRGVLGQVSDLIFGW